MRNRNPSDHESIAHQYLKDGSPFGGRSVLALVEDAARALEPGGDGLKGPGVAVPLITKAAELLAYAQVELGISIGKRQAKLLQKEKAQAKRRKIKA